MAKYIKTEQGYKTKEELAIQPDWNQNDPNAPDYVKNRTHWVDDPIEKVVFDETIDTTDGEWCEYAPLDFEEGDECAVVLDGVEYRTTVRVYNEDVYVGSASLLWGGEYNDAELPFAVVSDGWLIAYPYGEHAMKITVIKAKVHKIDEKYLPNSVVLAKSIFLGDYAYPVFDLGQFVIRHFEANLNSSSLTQTINDDGTLWKHIKQISDGGYVGADLNGRIVFTRLYNDWNGDNCVGGVFYSTDIVGTKIFAHELVLKFSHNIENGDITLSYEARAVVVEGTWLD